MKNRKESVRDMTSKFGKIEKYQGNDFHQWQKKMHFFLSILKVMYVLSTHMSLILEDSPLEVVRRRNKWKNDDYIYHEYILNGLSYALFDVY